MYIALYRLHRESGHLVGTFFGIEIMVGLSDILEGDCASLVIGV